MVITLTLLQYHLPNNNLYVCRLKGTTGVFFLLTPIICNSTTDYVAIDSDFLVLPCHILAEAKFGLWVLLLPASVCVCLCLCVRLCVSVNPELVRAKIPSNLRSLLFCVCESVFFCVCDLELQGRTAYPQYEASWMLAVSSRLVAGGRRNEQGGGRTLLLVDGFGTNSIWM